MIVDCRLSIVDCRLSSVNDRCRSVVYGGRVPGLEREAVIREADRRMTADGRGWRPGCQRRVTAVSLKQSLPQPTNATKKPIDSSARKSLIYIGMTGLPSGLGPALGGAARRENVQTESKTCRVVAERALSAVRKNPLEPAQTRGSRQKKANR